MVHILFRALAFLTGLIKELTSGSWDLQPAYDPGTLNDVPGMLYTQVGPITLPSKQVGDGCSRVFHITGFGDF